MIARRPRTYARARPRTFAHPFQPIFFRAIGVYLTLGLRPPARVESDWMRACVTRLMSRVRRSARAGAPHAWPAWLSASAPGRGPWRHRATQQYCQIRSIDRGREALRVTQLVLQPQVRLPPRVRLDLFRPTYASAVRTDLEVPRSDRSCGILWIILDSKVVLEKIGMCNDDTLLYICKVSCMVSCCTLHWSSLNNIS